MDIPEIFTLLPVRPRQIGSAWKYPNVISLQSVVNEVVERYANGAEPLDAFLSVAEGVQNWAAHEPKPPADEYVKVAFVLDLTPAEADRYDGTRYLYKADPTLELTIGDEVIVDTRYGKATGQVVELNADLGNWNPGKIKRVLGKLGDF